MTEQIAVTLGLEIVYIHGTVNGAEATWTLTAPGVWSAVVPKAEDGRYEVCITAYNSLGTPTYYETLIYRLEGLIPLKTDWTKEDYYNSDDLNRVEANTEYLARSLAAAGYTMVLEPVETGRGYTRIELTDDLNRVERNIHALVMGFIQPPDYVQPKIWEPGPHDYRDANRLEQNLQLLYDWLLAVVAGFKHCGAFACGEEGEIF